MRTLISAFALTMLLTVITGLVYPLAVCELAEVIFPTQARGSLIIRGDKI
ncbi:MAG TPA: potassium-transporting ATPase subunit C, partial [Methylomirabilota bacterium]|nr:potassium-transporting ATPase subunit C [Methylomirabilota bacterium]